MESLLKDPALADEGRSKVAYAGRRMPVLTAIREEFAASQPFKGRRISACLHVTTETANVVRA
ncbi:MAG: adenosylhomocysteinase, partial [Actinomycetota bacterium]|nr:adenosylhomocysteinase [Actinomycetota bacterium]